MKKFKNLRSNKNNGCKLYKIERERKRKKRKKDRKKKQH